MKNLIILLMMIALSRPSRSQEKEILFVMSSENKLLLDNGEITRQTGVFLNEFYLAYKTITDLGYKGVFATPNGSKISIDDESKKDKYWENNLETKKEALQFIKTNESFLKPISLENAIDIHEHFQGMIIPGGQGLMVDLIRDKNTPVLLKIFAKEQKPTGLICHAPILITTIPKSENPYIGYKVNCVSPLEEFVIENFIMKGKPKNRKIAKKLKELGLKYSNGFPKANYAVRDKNLVTSQNPYSSLAFNKLYTEALQNYKSKK